MVTLAAVHNEDETRRRHLLTLISAGYYRDQLEAAELQIVNLDAALVTARKIGAAIGIVMATDKLTYDEAFAFLGQVSQRRQEKLVKIADRVLFTGCAER